MIFKPKKYKKKTKKKKKKKNKMSSGLLILPDFKVVRYAIPVNIVDPVRDAVVVVVF